jgi:hypothetical protein
MTQDELSLDQMRESVVMTPEAIGDPDQTLTVFVGADLRALLNPCACGGVNGFHADNCAVSEQSGGAE